jgi:hypothetical protein
MPLSGLNRERFTLPDIVNPPDSLCFQIRVPNERWHLVAFFGVLFDLTQWINWELDSTHKATQAAQVWKKIWLDLQSQSCEVPAQVGTFSFEESSMLRTICENNQCFLEFQCCPGEWIRLANVDQLTNGVQPGPGAPQPPPGGGNQQYCGTLQASGLFLIPTPVSTGDTIELISAKGSGNDGGSIGWYCPDGSSSFAGRCSGSGHLDSSDPLNTVNHMSLIVEISGSFYALAVGSPLTVPAAISNVQPTIQVNDSGLGNNSGDYDICVKVTNNQSAEFTHTFDFVLADGGWTPQTSSGNPLGVWAGGAGWESVYGVASAGSTNNDIIINFPAHTITQVEVLYSTGQDAGSGGTRGVYYTAGAGQVLYGALDTGAGTFDTTITNTVTGIVQLHLSVDRFPAPDATTLIFKAIVKGLGADPFI